MALSRTRCPSCSEPLGDGSLIPLPLRCVRCGLPGQVECAADGQPAGFAATFTANQLVNWFAAARAAMAGGRLGIALGACAGCGWPLLVSTRQEVILPCPHCKEPVRGPSVEVLVDQWFEPWCRVQGSALDLEFRLALAEAARGQSVGCAACGAPTPAEDPSPNCRRCGAVAWAERGPGQRVQLGVRIDGVRADKPFNVFVPVNEGEQILRRDAALGASTSSGSSALGVFGIGCAVVVAIVIVLSLVIAIVVHYK